jgi:hypothetical protein
MYTEYLMRVCREHTHLTAKPFFVFYAAYALREALVLDEVEPDKAHRVSRDFDNTFVVPDQTLPMAARIAQVVRQAHDQKAAREGLCDARLEGDQKLTPSQTKETPTNETPNQNKETPSQTNETPNEETPSQTKETPNEETPSQTKETPNKEAPSQTKEAPSQTKETPNKEAPSQTKETPNTNKDAQNKDVLSNHSKHHEWSLVDHVVATLYVVVLANVLLKVLLQEAYVPVVFWGQDMPMLTVYMQSALETLGVTAFEVVCSLGWSVWEPIRNAKTTYQQRVAWWTCQAHNFSDQEELDNKGEEDEFDEFDVFYF